MTESEPPVEETTAKPVETNAVPEPSIVEIDIPEGPSEDEELSEEERKRRLLLELESELLNSQSAPVPTAKPAEE